MRYIVTIDWDSKQLYFDEVDSADTSHETFGFSIGYSIDKKLYIQSVIENSPAYETGIHPNMEVLKIDSLNFINNYNFCDYINYMENVTGSIILELIDINGETEKFILEKRMLFVKD